MDKQITFRLNNEDFAFVEKICDEEARSKASFIRFHVLKKIKEMKNAIQTNTL